MQKRAILFAILALSTITALAQITTSTGKQVRFVAPDGLAYNDGCTWATAKKDIQDAINDLTNAGLSGEVWVKVGTYHPTESTEHTSDDARYKSFMIPAGITVRGGFKGNENTELTGRAAVTAGKTGREMNPPTSSSVGENYKYRTILTGCLDDTKPIFEWNEARQQFGTRLENCCYHVVTFATNGFDEEGRAKPLGTTQQQVDTYGQLAKLEGFVVMHGNADNQSFEGHPHNAYGGGIYMVPGSCIENIYICQCEASRDGGAVYIDGGGVTEHCYISDCQAIGINRRTGFGGGVCVDENKQVFPPIVKRTSIVNCVARYGGGLATKINNIDLTYKTPEKTYDMRYNTGISGCLIANCVAQTEGGGVYAYKGGSYTQMTIVNNRCNGIGQIINGAATGKSAGIYFNDYGIIGNSLLWGGVNKRDEETGMKSAQFGSYRTTTKSKIEVRYVGISNANMVDWSGVDNFHTIKLSAYNTHSDAVLDSVDENISYPAFLNPSKVAGYEEGAAAKNYSGGYSYKVAYSSGATVAGVYTKDLDFEDKSPARDVMLDVQGQPFSSFPTIGAYTSEAPSMSPSIEWTKYEGMTGQEGILHVYVDPASTYADDEENAGSSWYQPLRHLHDALEKIGKNLQGIVDQAKYKIKEIQVHVKEGIVDFNGITASGSVRSNSFFIPSTKVTEKDGTKRFITLKILGGYTKFLGMNEKFADQFPSTDIYYQANKLDERNPVQNPTIISGALLNDYKYSIPHLLVIDGCENVIIDGFQFRSANATSSFHLTKVRTTGAALTISNSKNISLRNILVADCQASSGAAIYATNSEADFENCIFHNNTVDYNDASGIIYSDATSSLSFNHCDILRNVGYAFYNLGQVRMENSMVFANSWKPLEDTNYQDNFMLPAFKGPGKFYSTTKKNLFDIASKRTSGLKLALTGTGMESQVGKTTLEFAFNAGNNNNYPYFCNPTRTTGISTTGDNTYYGRSTSFQPHNGNPMINAASTDDKKHTDPTSSNIWGKDMSSVTNRDWGGLPDIGAIESHKGNAIDEGDLVYSDGQHLYGSITYVRDYHTYDTSDRRINANYMTEGRDGKSWENAINGNGIYKVEGGTSVNGLQYAIDRAHEVFVEDGEPQTVWVAEGQYTNSTATTSESHNQPYAYIMREGVNVYGGFPSKGTPGIEQRNPKKYKTILQSAPFNATGKTKNNEVSTGRVMVQSEDFDTKTVWYGLKLRNGYLNTVFRQDLNENTSAVNSSEIGASAGAGAYLMKNGILEYCDIDDNTVYSNPNDKATKHIGSSSGEFIQAGAGVFNDGGTICNCTIADNTLLYRLYDGTVRNVWMYGAGLFQNNGTVYNTIICRNKAAVDAHGKTATSEILAGAGLCIANGSFYNNTVTANTTSTASSENINISIPGIYLLKNVAIYNSIISGNTSEGNHEGEGRNIYNTQVASIDQDYNFQPNNITLIHSCMDLETAKAFPSQTLRNNIALPNAVNCIYNNPHLLAKATPEGQQYSLDAISPAINAGTENIGNDITLPDIDAEYGDRIHDCVIDMGAYEFNDAYAISPDLREKGKAVFYVTPYGNGNASASNPANAACADKLQLVLDAAGRYKYEHPDKKVLVKIANAKSLAQANKSQRDTVNFGYYNHFCYYATRTTNQQQNDIREYSIIIPRGVEVLGGYSDTGSKGNYRDVTDSDNGFYIYKKGKRQENRSILGNPTYFDGFFYNIKNSTTSTSYHVVTFTDHLFDANGNPYLAGDKLGTQSSYNSRANHQELKFMSIGEKVSDRAAIDGIFISDGMANISSSNYSGTSNHNQYGGAAIVPGYAHIRKCIIRGNSANYGGALALLDSAVVSGCIIDNNSARYGGGIYIMKNGTKISDFKTVQTGTNVATEHHMPKIFTSTIANNSATDEGGGLWFSEDYANVRVNSTVIWHNDAKYDSNVFGAYAPEKPLDDSTYVVDFYPFAYSAVENIRMSGVNNITVAHDNDKGVRFANTNDYTLTNYSALLSGGMPKETYYKFIKEYKISRRDINDTLRADGFMRTYTDIGAEGFNRRLPMTHLMTRLYVAKADNIDINAAKTMMSLDPEKAKNETERNIFRYYQQEGSSFAFPFQNLQEALDYISFMRGITRIPTEWQSFFRNNIKDIDKSASIPFEIFVAKGTYYPTKSTEGRYGESLSNTYSIPEGVSIYGGLDAQGLSSTPGHKNEFYGGLPTPTVDETALIDPDTEYHIENNVSNPKVTKKDREFHLGNYTISRADTQTILESRELTDNNNDGIISPWEYKNQTILSGNSINVSTNGVYHVITIVPDENVVGVLPHPVSYNGKNGRPTYNTSDKDLGYVPHEYGQPITLDGITVTDGNAHNINNIQMDDLSKNYYYHGGGMLVDGNRFNDNKADRYYTVDDYNKATGDTLTAEQFSRMRKFHLATYMHANRTNAVGYRNIPVYLKRCRFTNNSAGYGGAISTNTDLNIINCDFDNNTASGGTEKTISNGQEIHLSYPGHGGAIFSTCSLTVEGSLFQNNFARNDKLTLDLQRPLSYRNQDISHVTGVLSGCGGAIYSGKHGLFHINNCQIVHNKANVYPAIFTMNPNNSAQTDSTQCNQVRSTTFIGNEVFTEMHTKYQSNNLYNFAARLICNYGQKQQATNEEYSPEFVNIQDGIYFKGVPATQGELDDMQDMISSSRYEAGRGMTSKQEDGNYIVR